METKNKHKNEQIGESMQHVEVLPEQTHSSVNAKKPTL
jgi:hypothetical protein